MMYLCQVLESQTGDFITEGNKLFTRSNCKTLVKCMITHSHEGMHNSHSIPETGGKKTMCHLQSTSDICDTTLIG